MYQELELQVKALFSANDLSITSTKHIHMHLVDDVICLQYVIDEDNQKDSLLELYDELALEAFIRTYSIRTLQNIYNLQPMDLWTRWFNEQAEAIYTNGDGNKLCFRLHRNKTMIYSTDLKYYDEVNKIMSVTRDFTRYLSQHEDHLEMLSYKA